MGTRLTKYDHDLRRRLEKIREKNHYSQAQMAVIMGVSLETYKRYEYGKNRVPVESIVNLINNLNEDPDYVIYGKPRGIANLVDYYMGSSDAEKAAFFMELSRVFKKKSEIDYMTDDGDIIETNGKKSDK